MNSTKTFSPPLTLNKQPIVTLGDSDYENIMESNIEIRYPMSSKCVSNSRSGLKFHQCTNNVHLPDDYIGYAIEPAIKFEQVSNETHDSVNQLWDDDTLSDSELLHFCTENDASENQDSTKVLWNDDLSDSEFLLIDETQYS